MSTQKKQTKANPNTEDVQAALQSLIAQGKKDGMIRAENACLTLRDLAVNGKDMMALGLRGAEIGKTLNALLDAVLEERLPNDREALLRYAGEMGLSLTN